MARVVHVPFCYFPDAVGGTEVYVRELAREQLARGDDVLILAPAEQRRSYQHDGLPVERFTVSNRISDVRDLYGAGQTSVEEFVAVLERFRPDVLHVHGLGRAIAPEALRRARELGMRVVITYHTPTATCVRGTMLLHGVQPCDGVLDAQRCTACTLSGHGVPRVVAATMARAPATVGTLARATRMRGRIATALRTRELVALRHTHTRALLAAADHIVAPAEWVTRVLHRLGAPPAKVTLSRQGIAATARPPRSMRTTGPLKLVYVGRLEPAKGVQLLTRALRTLTESRVELHVYGITQGDAHAGYRAELRAAAARDTRITLHEPVAPDAVVPTIARYDVLVVPSQQMETGPLVVLEAFAAGLPVLGSRLGGIAELVHHGHDGLLVEGRGVLGWVAALERLLRDPDLLPRLQQGVRAPRTMAAVADDMTEVYRKVTG